MTNQSVNEMQRRVREAATPANAEAYCRTDEKFTFALDLLGLSLTDDGDVYCDKWVNRLEDQIEALIAANMSNKPED